MTKFERAETARWRVIAFVILGLLAFSFRAAEAATLEVVVSNPPSFKQLKVQYGTCNGQDIASVLGTKIVDSPASSVLFTNVTPAVTCIRVVWTNEFGESLPAKGVTGPPPQSGSIVTVQFSQ